MTTPDALLPLSGSNVTMILLPIATLTIAFIASRGKHSKLHHRLARWAMAFSILAFLFHLIDLVYFALFAFLIVIGCYITVFVTDDRQGRTPIAHMIEVMAKGWRIIITYD